jgi:hypothetical protein
MDKLGGDIYGNHGYQGHRIDKEVAETVKSFPAAAAESEGFETNLSIENLF